MRDYLVPGRDRLGAVFNDGGDRFHAGAARQEMLSERNTKPTTGRVFLDSSRERFAKQKELAERAFCQLDDDQIRRPLDANTNSVAVIMKHLAGNMLSRWTDFLTTDGEKEWRDRDREFIDDFASRDDVEAYWEQGWAKLFESFDRLDENDLIRVVKIRGEAHSVILAILRQIDHTGYHVGQIVQTSRILAGDRWTVLSIARGGSEEYNRRIWKHDVDR